MTAGLMRAIKVLAWVLALIQCAASTTTSMTVVTSGTSLFYTRHADSKCQDGYFGIKWPTYTTSFSKVAPLQINTCLRTSAAIIKVQCKIGASKFTIWQTQYAANDAQCANPLSSKPLGIQEHENLCQPDMEYGGYIKVQCGQDSLLTTVTSLPSFTAPALYPTSSCTATRIQSYSLLLDTCTPMYEATHTGGAKQLDHLYKLSQTSVLTYTVRKYLKTDLTCSGRVTSQKNIVYPPASTSTISTQTNSSLCVPDPLFKGRYYLNVPNSIPRGTTNAAPTPTHV